MWYWCVYTPLRNCNPWVRIRLDNPWTIPGQSSLWCFDPGQAGQKPGISWTLREKSGLYDVEPGLYGVEDRKAWNRLDFSLQNHGLYQSIRKGRILWLCYSGLQHYLCPYQSVIGQFKLEYISAYFERFELLSQAVWDSMGKHRWSIFIGILFTRGYQLQIWNQVSVPNEILSNVMCVWF